MKYQVVILAGGTSSRFFPFNKLHKSFSSLAGKRIIEHTLLGIKKHHDFKIIIVLGRKNYKKEKELLGKISDFDDVKIVCQEKPLGQANAILAAKGHITGDFFVVNAQQLNFHSMAGKLINEHSAGKYLATISSVKTDQPQEYGILEYKDGEVCGVVEKPLPGKEPSNMRIVGTYLFSKEFLTELEKTSVSEYSLETTIDRLAKDGKVGGVKFKGALPSLKYPWDILSFKEFVFENVDFKIDKTAKIEKTAIIKGKVFVGKNARICDYAVVQGPAYIGDGVVVGAYSQVRGGSILGEGSEIQRYVDLKNSVLGRQSSIHSGFVGDSVIGDGVKVGAGFISANRRIDRSPIKATVKGKRVVTGLNGLGVIIGDGAKLGIRVSTMPGAIIGGNSVVFPNVELKGTIAENAVVKKQYVDKTK